jgi:hypothetical protein
MTFLISAPHHPLTSDERGYIEYCLFSALRPFEPDVGLVQVEIRGRATAEGARAISCIARADSASIPIVARGTSHRLYGAVDIAARRLAQAVESALVAASSRESETVSERP